MRRYTGRFWNVILPVALALVALFGFATVVADIIIGPTEAVSTWWGWTGLIVGVAAAMAFKGCFHWLAREDNSYERR